jgi:molybdate transport system permease protein
MSETGFLEPNQQRQINILSLGLASLPLLAFLFIPLVAILVRSGTVDVLNSLQAPEVWQAIGLSLTTTLVATLLTVVAGTPLAYLLARHRFRFRRAVDTLIDLPTVMPPSVAGVALLMAFGRQGLMSPLFAVLGLHIAFSTAAVVMAQLFIAAPFYVRAATIGFMGVERELEQSALLDGANRWQAFRLITVPLSWTALLSGAVTTWARALGEFGATIIFAGNFPGRTQTMPLAIYIGFETDLNVALGLSVILIVVAIVSLLSIRMLVKQG